MPSPDGPTWIVSDALFNVAGPLRGFSGAVLRVLHTGPALDGAVACTIAG